MAAGSWPPADPPTVPPFVNLNTADFNNANAARASSISATVNMKVSFPVYAMAMLGFVGWFLFVIFAGIGLASLPVDLICAYVYRPRHMDAREFAEAQVGVRGRVNELIEIGEMLRGEREEKKEAGGG